MFGSRNSSASSASSPFRHFSTIYTAPFYYGKTLQVKVPYHLIVLLFLVTLYRSVIIFKMCQSSNLNPYHYTYWNYILMTFFDISYLVFLFTTSKGFQWLNIVFFPMVLGSSIMVNVLIVIILQSNDELLVNASVFGTGNMQLGDLHVADYVVHTLPLLGRGLLLMMGQYEIVKRYVSAYLLGFTHLAPVRTEHGNISGSRKIIYPIYWIFCLLILVIPYGSIYDPFYIYPTNYSVFESILIFFPLLVVVQTLTLVAFTGAPSFEPTGSLFVSPVMESNMVDNKYTSPSHPRGNNVFNTLSFAENSFEDWKV